MIISYRFRTLLYRELLRIREVILQAILSPIVTSLLYFVVFGVSIGSRIGEIHGVSYLAFIVPGLIMMNVIGDSYSNSAFSLFIMKIMGNIVDILVSPIRYAELISAYIIASLLRSSAVGIIIWIVSLFFTPFRIDHPAYVLGFIVLTSAVFSLIGLIMAIFSKKFEHISIMPSFILTPLSFLGGVFYSIESLPEIWQKVSLFNPLVYMISGLRYGFYGIADINPGLSLAIISAIVVVLYLVAYKLLASGYKLRT
jgi:ABC-2 type transport system permease protein